MRLEPMVETWRSLEQDENVAALQCTTALIRKDAVHIACKPTQRSSEGKGSLGRDYS
jgi:hypothetical protein